MPVPDGAGPSLSGAADVVDVFRPKFPYIAH